MSYKGYVEYILEDGRYIILDDNPYDYVSQDNILKNLPSPIKWFHTVDTTNGACENCPGTFPASKNEIGFLDEWHEDHYGNKYAIKIRRYIPTSKHWQKQDK